MPFPSKPFGSCSKYVRSTLRKAFVRAPKGFGVNPRQLGEWKQ